MNEELKKMAEQIKARIKPEASPKLEKVGDQEAIDRNERCKQAFLKYRRENSI